MSDVVNMFDPDKSTVEGLQELLERARAGKIRNFIFVTSDGQDMFKMTAGSFNTDDLFKLSGLLDVIKTEISLDLIQDSQISKGE